MKFTYLLIDVMAVLVPFIFSFHPKIRFNIYFNAFVKANIITVLLFILWDILFTSLGVWSFSATYTLGISIFNLPVEEILFFICIPFACTFTYFCLATFKKFDFDRRIINGILILIASFLIYFSYRYSERLYTMVTFLTTAFILLILTFTSRLDWMGKYLVAYLVLLLPFFIVNGLLTGTGLAGPVVMYNQAEIIGIRLFTIPVEDFVYAFEMLLLNVYFFEQYRIVSKEKQDMNVQY